MDATGVGTMRTASLRAGWYAVGDTGLSLLSDHFPRERRVLAMSVYLVLGSAGAISGGLIAAAVLAVGCGNFFMALPSGASVAAISEITPAALRGRVSAIYYLSISLVGIAAGPLSVALCTDYLFQDPRRVGDSLSLVSVVIGPLAAWAVWSALPEFRRWTLQPESAEHGQRLKAGA
jgi:MFS family permease